MLFLELFARIMNIYWTTTIMIDEFLQLYLEFFIMICSDLVVRLQKHLPNINTCESFQNQT